MVYVCLDFYSIMALILLVPRLHPRLPLYRSIHVYLGMLDQTQRWYASKLLSA